MENQTILNLLKKKDFVDRVSYAISGQPRISIVKIEYEVYEDANNNNNYYDEFVKVTYDGGAIAIRTVTGTSLSGIFRDIAKMIDGGYYDEVKYYADYIKSGKYVQVIGNNPDALVNSPFLTEMCWERLRKAKTYKEAKALIKTFPASTGKWSVESEEDCKTYLHYEAYQTEPNGHIYHESLDIPVEED